MTAPLTMLPLPPGRSPRPWQPLCVDAIREGFRHYRAVIASAATGTGKGSVLAGLCWLVAERGGRVLVLVHREELVTDLAARVRELGDRHRVGVVMGPLDEWDCPIVVASVQSCTAKRRASIGHVDLVIVDECHHAVAPSYRAVLDAVAAVNPGYKHVGFTATPFRSAEDGGTRGLGAVYEAVVFEHGIRDAIDAGDLVPLRAWQVSTDVDLSSVAIVGGDFDAEDLAKAVDTPARNRVVVDQYRQRARGLPALAFSVDIAHAEHLAEAFREQGVRAAAVSGETPRDLRRQLVADFRRGDGTLDVLCSCDLLFEGFDAPCTRIVLKARPTKSRIVFQQMVGRGLRLFPGKAECLFVDLVDNGVPLDLATAADLADDGDGDAKASALPLKPGDRCRRRHHDDWGQGVVLQVLEGELRRAKVRWPVTRIHQDGAELTHPCVELRRVREGEEEGEQLSIAPRVRDVRAYEVFLLPTGPGKNRVGWYEYRGSWSAGGQLADGRRRVLLVTGAAARWETWEVECPAMRATRRNESTSMELAIAWGQSHADAIGLRIEPVEADWKGDPCTAGQRSAMAAKGIRRDTSRMSRGEASALLDAVSAKQAVVDAGRTPQERARASQRRDFMRFGKRRAG